MPLSAPQTRVHSSGNIEAGASIAWSSPADPAVQKVDVTLPDGTVDAGRKATYRNGRWEFTYPNAFLPGLYQLHFTPTEIAQPIFYGVSIDRRELDNTPLSAEDNEWLQKGKFLDSQNAQVKPSELAFVITREDKGMEIWKLLALFVLATRGRNIHDVSDGQPAKEDRRRRRRVDAQGIMYGSPCGRVFANAGPCQGDVRSDDEVAPLRVAANQD